MLTWMAHPTARMERRKFCQHSKLCGIGTTRWGQETCAASRDMSAGTCVQLPTALLESAGKATGRSARQHVGGPHAVDALCRKRPIFPPDRSDDRKRFPKKIQSIRACDMLNHKHIPHHHYMMPASNSAYTLVGSACGEQSRPCMHVVASIF